jgi:hypothetical protein
MALTPGHLLTPACLLAIPASKLHIDRYFLAELRLESAPGDLIGAGGGAAIAE